MLHIYTYNSAPYLCLIWQLDVSDQFEEIVDVTEEADSFNSLDISIASAVINKLVLSDEITTNADVSAWSYDEAYN